MLQRQRIDVSALLTDEHPPLVTRKRLVATASRREGACNRAGKPSGIFCGKRRSSGVSAGGLLMRSKKSRRKRCVACDDWLRKKDLNPHKQSQSLSCCHYTIPQNRCEPAYECVKRACRVYRIRFTALAIVTRSDALVKCFLGIFSNQAEHFLTDETLFERQRRRSRLPEQGFRLGQGDFGEVQGRAGGGLPDHGARPLEHKFL